MPSCPAEFLGVSSFGELFLARWAGIGRVFLRPLVYCCSSELTKGIDDHTGKAPSKLIIILRFYYLPI